jgi:hypothetical protein
MPKIRPLQGDQLTLDEWLPEMKTIAHKPVKKALRKRPLYRVKKHVKRK